ncbi:hypothetical protein C8R44DRAFT_705230 [Mycena epipterygia]|nr:hypothetical protein C8R44DRAFT_705230 [Mycena epipterygia]
MAPNVLADNLILAGLETLLYGIYLVLFFMSMYFLVRRYASTHSWTNKPRKPLRSPVFSFSIVLFLANTGHWVGTAIRTWLAFIRFQGDPECSVAFFNDPSHPTRVAQTWLLAVALIMGDGLIIHRL